MSIADELAKLDALRQSGVLTQEEFNAEKAKLLAGILPASTSSSPQPSGVDSPRGEEWWQASDGKWYAPESRRDYQPPLAPSATPFAMGVPLPPTQASPVVGSESSVASKSGLRRTRPLILASASTLVVVIAAVILIVSLGQSANSPSSVVTKWSSSYAKGHSATVCSALVPSQQAVCISSSKGYEETTKNFGIGRVHAEGDRSLVVTTGTYCSRSSSYKGCTSNTDPNLGFDSGQSFTTLWTDVTSLEGNPRLWSFIVPTQKESGRWYVTLPYFASSTTTTTSGGSGNQDTDAESDLQTALTGADTFFTYANQTYTGIMGGTQYSSIAEIDTGLSYVGASTASTGPSTISIRESGGYVLVLTAYAPASGTCWGILDMKSSTVTPVFPDYPETTTTGTYYFSSQQSGAGNCKATITSPDLLSANGW